MFARTAQEKCGGLKKRHHVAIGSNGGARKELFMRSHLPAIAVIAFSAGSAAALDLPSRKAGLWEIKTMHDNPQMPPQVMQHCIDAATDKAMNDKLGGGQDMCSKQQIRKSGNALVAESSCKFGATAATTRAVYEGDFNSAYTVKVTATQEGGPARPQMRGTNNFVIEAKWKGPCNAGQRPGDVVMSNGTKINVLELPQGAPKPPAIPQR
jgi:hypothetical protein